MRKVQVQLVILLMLGWSVFLCMLTYLLCSGVADDQDGVINPRQYTEAWHRNDLMQEWVKSTNVPEELPPLMQESLQQGLPEKSHKSNWIPSVEHEISRRKVENAMREFWMYVQYELASLKEQTVDMDTAKMIESIRVNTEGFKSLLSEDFKTLSRQVGGSTGTGDWRLEESVKLGRLVQARIEKLQNPDDCRRSRLLYCTWDTLCGGGFGCQLHHLTYCLMMAYATNRTLVFDMSQAVVSPWPSLLKSVSKTCHSVPTSKMEEWGNKEPALLANAQVLALPRLEFLNPRSRLVPMTLPADLADQIRHFHGSAPVWWVGQFVKYIMRPQSELTHKLEKYINKAGFSQPIVGLHVRRTDKLYREATYHSLEEYMRHVDNWFSKQDHRTIAGNRPVYLATDDPDVIVEARKKFPQYSFIYNTSAAQVSHEPQQRSSKDALLGVILDILLLSRTDHLVCTLTSNVCRAAYELMQSRHGDASVLVTSLDNTYFFEAAKRDRTVVTAIDSHLAARPDEISLHINDSLFIFNNHGNGFSFGRNLRTRKTGVFPSYKVIYPIHAENMPTMGDPT